MLQWVRFLPLVVVLTILLASVALRLVNTTLHAIFPHRSACYGKATGICSDDPSVFVAGEDEDGLEDYTEYIRVEDLIKVGEHESSPVPVVLVPLLA